MYNQYTHHVFIIQVNKSKIYGTYVHYSVTVWQKFSVFFPPLYLSVSFSFTLSFTLLKYMQHNFQETQMKLSYMNRIK